MKSIYIYSHVKTSLKDPERQPIEKATNIFLIILSFIFMISSIFKIFVIIFYFIFIQAFSALINPDSPTPASRQIMDYLMHYN